MARTSEPWSADNGRPSLIVTTLSLVPTGGVLHKSGAIYIKDFCSGYINAVVHLFYC
jgi:hypothetical protein